jgi:hypothetical protein
MHAICSAHLILPDLIIIIFVKNTSYEASYYAVFSNLILFHSSWVQIFTSAPYSQLPFAYLLSLMPESKFQTLQNYRQDYSFVYSYINLYVFRQ